MAVSLQFEKRDKKVSPHSLRKSGKLPAVFYGRKQAPSSISLSLHDFEKVWKKAGEHTIINLRSSGGEEIQALLHEVHKHPVTNVPRHADFYVFEKGQKLKVKIPIEFVGTSPAVKDLGAVLVKVMHDLEIEAEPKDLPQKIEINISSLDAFGKVITAKEIALPKGVNLVVSPDEVLASVYEPKEEVVEAVPADLSTIEVVKKGKEEVPGEGGAATAAPAGAEAQPKKEERGEEKKTEGRK